jgi:hypothetical protein
VIGRSGIMLRTVTVNAPVTPTFSGASGASSTNTLGGLGSFEFQFNATKRTANVASVSNSGAPSNTTINYFTASDLVDANDYEVMVTMGSSTGHSNIALAGGSASLSTWYTLSASPLFKFALSGRRGGTQPITIAIRHKVSTGVTASTVFTMTQSSDAVSPVFSGIGGTTSVIRTSTDTFLGIYIDAATSANAGQIRTYKNTTLFTQTGFTFSTGAIPESEYEMSTSSTLITPGGGLIDATTSGTYGDVSTYRALAAAWNSSIGRFWSRLGTEPPATGRILLNMRHKLDENKFAQAQFNFSTT